MTSPPQPSFEEYTAPLDGGDEVDEPQGPPLPWLLGYRVLGLRLPDQYRAWVARDVASPMFLTFRIARTYLWCLALIGLLYVGMSAVHEPPGRTRLIQLVLITLAVSLLSSGATLVRRTLRWQRVDRRGRPVKPKGLAVLGNAEAVALGLAVLVAFTSLMALWGFALRPTGYNAVKCRPPDDQLLSRLRGGLKDTATQIERPQTIPMGQSQLLAAYLRKPGAAKPDLGFWLVEGETIYELRPASDPGKTTFQPPPAVDRLAPEAVMRIAGCLSGKGAT